MQHQLASLEEEGFIRRLILRWKDVPDRKEFPFSIPCIQSLTELELHPQVTFFVGENGSGKSTLLEAIAIAWGFPAEGGTTSHAYRTAGTHTELHECLTLVRPARRPKDGFFLRAESMYNLATYAHKVAKEVRRPGRFDKLHFQSHGESFLSAIATFREGLYILDEPEAALSPQRQLTLIVEMFRLIRQGAQFIIATHSPILMAFPYSKLLLFDEKEIRPVEYKETDHYNVTKAFLASPESFLARLDSKDLG